MQPWKPESWAGHGGRRELFHWNKPLSRWQLEYCGLDAWAVRAVFDALTHRKQELAAEREAFMQRNRELAVSRVAVYRPVVLPADGPAAGDEGAAGLLRDLAGSMGFGHRGRFACLAYGRARSELASHLGRNMSHSACARFVLSLPGMRIIVLSPHPRRSAVRVDLSLA